MDPGLRDLQLHRDLFLLMHLLLNSARVSVCVCEMRREDWESEASFLPSTPQSQWFRVSKINIPIALIQWKQVHMPMGMCADTGEAFTQSTQVVLDFLIDTQ